MTVALPRSVGTDWRETPGRARSGPDPRPRRVGAQRRFGGPRPGRFTQWDDLIPSDLRGATACGYAPWPPAWPHQTTVYVGAPTPARVPFPNGVQRTVPPTRGPTPTAGGPWSRCSAAPPRRPVTSATTAANSASVGTPPESPTAATAAALRPPPAEARRRRARTGGGGRAHAAADRRRRPPRGAPPAATEIKAKLPPRERPSARARSASRGRRRAPRGPDRN